MEAGKSGVELLAAQCKKDFDEQAKKIDIILNRFGKKSDSSNAGTFLADFAKFRKAALERADLGEGLIKKRKEVESKNMTEKMQDLGVDDLETPIESEANEINDLNLSKDSSKVDSILELENKT